MDPDQVKAAVEALKNNDAAAALAILEALIVSAASGEAGSMPPPAGGIEGDPSAQGADTAPAVAAALTELRKLTARASLGEVVETVRVMCAARDRAAAELVALEQTSRVELTAELVKLGYELPATAWDGDPQDRKPAKHLAAMPVADLRARVVALRAQPRTPAAPKPPVGSGGSDDTDGRAIKTSKGLITLSAREIANCESAGVKLEAYAENKAIREAARAGKTAK